MVLKEFFFFSACLCLELAFADLEKLEDRPRCRVHTIVCPCMEHRGVKLNVTVELNTCGVDDLIGKKSVCNREAILTKCRKAHLLSERHRRNAESQNSINCLNGSIIPTESSSALKGPPKADMVGYQKNAWLNHDVSFTCVVSSNLSATISWLFNGKALVPVKNRHSYHSCKTVLLIKRVLSKDTGNYTCVVQNKVGQAMASSRLSVISRDNGPYIEYVRLDGDNGDTAFTGTTVNVTCKIQDYRVVNTFLKGKQKIEEGDGKHEFFQMPDSQNNVKIVNLEIKNITKEDGGNYTCIAILPNGSDKRETFHLKVVNLTEICDPGYFCPAGSVQPIPCPWATYQPKVGQSSAHACIQCPDFDKLNKSNSFNTKPAANITDCPSAPTESVEQDKEPPPPSHLTPTVIGLVAGIFVFFIIPLVIYCVAKNKRCLSLYSRSKTNNHSSPESLPCGPVFTINDSQRQSLCENMQNSPESQIVKKVPEIDYEPKYDVFICYSYKDVSWVKDELFAELEKRGFTCCIDFKDFVPGAAIVENISQAICYSKKTIAVLTPDFVESEWCGHELQKALTRIRFHQVVPVVYRSCEIPLTLQDRTYLDWENCHVKPYFWDHLENALRQPNDGVL